MRKSPTSILINDKYCSSSLRTNRHPLTPTVLLDTESDSRLFFPSSSNKSRRRSPRTIDDNLHWRCPSCSCLVATKETQSHLTCFMSFLEGRKSSSLSIIHDNLTGTPTNEKCPSTTQSSSSSTNSLLDMGSVASVRQEGTDKKEEEVGGHSTPTRPSRPQTRIVKRPTPNIKHPVITKDDYKTHPSSKMKKGTECSEVEASMEKLIVDRSRKKRTGCDLQAWSQFKASLSPCHKCKRLFFPYRLAAHERTCDEVREGRSLESDVCGRKVDKNIAVARSDDDVTEEERKEWEEHLNNLKACRKCRRTFFPNRLKIHEQSCQGKPAKSPAR